MNDEFPTVLGPDDIGKKFELLGKGFGPISRGQVAIFESKGEDRAGVRYQFRVVSTGTIQEAVIKGLNKKDNNRWTVRKVES